MRRLIISLLMLAASLPAGAENILMTRSYQSFDVVLQAAKDSLASHGYTVAHEQRCDGGLNHSGYQTDYYRVIFFGKPEEVRYLSQKYPELIPYLPLKLAVFAEEDQMLAVSFNPEVYGQFFTRQELKTQFARWKADLDSVLADLRSIQQIDIGAAASPTHP